MAFENLGIGGILSFDSGNANSNMNSASKAFDFMENSANKAKKGLDEMTGGFGKLALAAAPIALMLGFGAKSAIDFEHQMGAVASVAQVSAGEMDQLTRMAKKLGVETQFSSTQVAQGMEELAKAGFDTKEIMVALPGVLAAAAAEGITLSQSAEITSGVLRGMNLQTSESSRVANVLAQTASSTATSILGLGESFSYAGTTAAQRNISLEQTAAVLGLLGNANIKGSAAGTAFNAMLRQMLEITPRSQAALDQLKFSFFDAHGAMKPLPLIIDQFKTSLAKVGTEKERLTIVQKIFGDEGARGFNVLLQKGGGALTEMTEKLKHASEATDEHGNVIGAAAKMAAARMDNFAGAMTLLKSSTESFFITVVGPFLKPFAGGIKALTDGLNNVIFAIEMIRTNVDESGKTVDGQNESVRRFGKTTTAVALGIIDVMDSARKAIEWVGEKITQIGKYFGAQGESSVRSMVALIGKILLVGAVLVPIVGIVGILGLAISGVIAVVSGLFTFLVGAAPFIAAAFSAPGMLVAGLLYLLYKALPYIKAFVLGFVEGFVAGAAAAWGVIKKIGSAMMWVIDKIGGWVKRGMEVMGVTYDMGGAADSAAVSIQTVGKWIGYVVGILAILKLAVMAVTAVQWLWNLAMMANPIGLIILAVVVLLAVIATMILYWDKVAVSAERAWLAMMKVAQKNPLLTKAERETNAKDMEWMTNDIQTREFAIAEKDREGRGDFISRLTEKLGIENSDAMKLLKGAHTPVGATEEANQALGMDAQGKGTTAQPPPGAQNVKLDATINAKTDLCVDGRHMASAMAKHQTEISERAGFNQTPWQRKIVATDGVTRGGGSHD